MEESSSGQEIEEGIKPNVIDTIREPLEIQQRILDMLKEAMHDLLILFSTTNSFYRLERHGILQLLIAAAEHDVRIRMIIEDRKDSVRQAITKQLQNTSGADKIDIRYIHRDLPTKTTTIQTANICWQ
jgi:hypothetical protein